MIPTAMVIRITMIISVAVVRRVTRSEVGSNNGARRTDFDGAGCRRRRLQQHRRWSRRDEYRRRGSGKGGKGSPIEIETPARAGAVAAKPSPIVASPSRTLVSYTRLDGSLQDVFIGYSIL